MLPRAIIEELLRQTIGLDTAAVGPSAIDHAVRSRMAGLGLMDLESYAERLRTSEAEIKELIEAVVVPETWFFRHPDAFTALVRLVMDEWLPVHPTGLLRVLSVPCASGEEPYSIAMALLESGLPGHRFQVDAVDISSRALTQARRAVYGPNSFRGQELTFRERYFRRIQNDYHLAEPIREQVRFQHGNLVAPDFVPGAACYDFIFCRNVLIYFDRATQERVIQTLCRLLTPSGVLLVGPAEALLAIGGGLAAVGHSMAFAYRRSTTRSHPSPELRLCPPGKTRTARPVRPVQCLLPLCPEPVASAAVTIPEPPPRPSAELETAGRLADAGRLDEAANVCEAHLRERGTSTEAYYLLGLVHDARGEHEEAAACYHKVLYLEPEHREALTHLALLAQKQGDAAGARRLQARARRVEERVRRHGA